MSHQNPPPYDNRKLIGSPQEKNTDIRSRFITTSPTSAATGERSSSGLAGPQTLAWIRNGLRGSKIYLVPPPVAGSSEPNEKRKKGDLVPEGATPSYNLHMGCKVITLSTAGGEDAQEKLLISGSTEGHFNTRSTYYDDESLTHRNVEMYRATGQDGGEADSIFSKRRTFDDFDSYKYKWSTNCCSSNQECVRLSDGAVVVSFRRFCLSFKHMGQFTLHRSVPEKTLQLLLTTCGVCYQLQGRR